MRAGQAARRWMVAGLGCGLLLWLVIGQPGSGDRQTVAALGTYAGAWYRVYFTRPQPNGAVGDRRAGMDAALLADLGRARHTIDLAAFDFDLRSLADGLKQAKRRGVTIRLVIDAENLEKPRVAFLLGELQKSGIPITFDRRAAFMHNKFVLVDSRIVWTGSWNLTQNDTFRNNNNMLRIVSPELAANYAAKFAALFAGRGGPGGAVALPYPQLLIGGAPVLNAFSPDAAITSEVIKRLNSARQSIDILAFTFTAEPLARAVLAAQARGVRVRGVFETRNARAGSSSIGLLQHGGADVHMDGNCFTMHHKVIVIDGEMVITGSFNWTRAAQQANDENVLMIRDRALAAQYTAEFERLYAQALRPDRCS